MPVGRHRKPFSTKQKKEQLQAKRERKRNAKDDSTTSSSDEQQQNEQVDNVSEAVASAGLGENEQAVGRTAQAAKSVATRLINHQPVKPSTSHSGREYNPNRFNLQFVRETPEELKKLRKNAAKVLEKRDEHELEIDINDVYKPSSPLDMPIRPKWTYEMTREQLEQQERTQFAKYLDTIFENFKHDELSYFEMNLETWRQLWRVLEISDIVLLIVDIRFPALHFSPIFYDTCVNLYKKDVILVLNKIDLVPTSTVVAWKQYFTQKYPHLHVLLFSSSKQIKHRHKRRTSISGKGTGKKEDVAIDDEQAAVMALAADIYTARAHRQLYECVKSIVKDHVDLSSWSALTERQIKTAMSFSTAQAETDSSANAGKDETDVQLTNEDANQMDELFHTTKERKRFENGFVTIGCCGFPNVGKSSLLNSLNGKKVVSVSRTPGHTKHLQTIFLTKSVRLCDCPGLVFPSLINKQLQILAGIYPIAQLQEPYSSVRYLSERIPVTDILKLKHPSEDTKHPEKDIEWSPLDVCESWAIKRGYYTAKASRPDVYRAANELLRMALDGRLCLSLKPKGYYAQREKLANDEEVKNLDGVVHSVEEMCKKNAASYMNMVNSRNRNASSDHKKDNYQSYDGDDDSEEEEEYGGRDPLGDDDEDTVSDGGVEDQSLKTSSNPFDLLADNE